jgi:hypothetical protein
MTSAVASRLIASFLALGAGILGAVLAIELLRSAL